MLTTTHASRIRDCGDLPQPLGQDHADHPPTPVLRRDLHLLEVQLLAHDWEALGTGALRDNSTIRTQQREVTSDLVATCLHGGPEGALGFLSLNIENNQLFHT